MSADTRAMQGTASQGRMGPTLLGSLLLFVSGIYLLTFTLTDAVTGRAPETSGYLWVFLLHLAMGLLLLPWWLWRLLRHVRPGLMLARPSQRRAGLVLLLAVLALLASGLLLLFIDSGDHSQRLTRLLAYAAHLLPTLLVPLLLFWHRRGDGQFAPARLAAWVMGCSLPAVVLALIGMPTTGPKPVPLAEISEQNFTLASTGDGQPIAAERLMLTDYCADCHQETHASWQDSMHRFSSFNNPAYRFSVRELRRVSQQRFGDGRMTDFCAGCHDPVPLLSERLKRADFDDEKDATADQGLTCIACHAIDRINSVRGNGDYTLTDPEFYPFTFSDQPLLKAVNHALIKARPELHKRSFLKPLHRSAEFCSVCHKVGLPEALNQYKWLRGQNHYDSFLLSGVSGHGASSFYYPKTAVERCSDCHMRLIDAPEDFAAFESQGPKVHDHMFPAANTAIGPMLGLNLADEARQQVLEDALRIDLFGLRRDGQIDGELIAPLRPALPRLAAGETWLVELVLRTLKLGHLFTQGTIDSNEIWVELEARLNDQPLAISGGRDASGEVDRLSHFVNAWVLDREGRRVDRRNAQDIITTLYNHQIPPGAADSLHYRLELPADASGRLQLTARLYYRKFDTIYLRHIRGDAFQRNDLPLVTIAEDRLELAVGEADAPSGERIQQEHPLPSWLRWNDYGIGLLRKNIHGASRGELLQAEQAFAEVERLGRSEGAMNLARTYLKEGDLDRAAAALLRAAEHAQPADPWSLAWFGGLINKQRGYLDEAIADFRLLAENRFDAAAARGFDFSRDYRVLNELGQTLSERARGERGESRARQRLALLQEARNWFQRSLELDPENATAHYNLARIASELGDDEAAAEHRQLHQRYKVDDQVEARVVTLARRADPVADQLAEAVVIYPLRPSAAPATEFPNATQLTEAEGR